MHEGLVSHTRELDTPSSSMVSSHPQPHRVTKQSQSFLTLGPSGPGSFQMACFPRVGLVVLWLHLQDQLDTYVLSTCTRVNTGLIFLVSSNINYPILLSPIFVETSQKS